MPNDSDRLGARPEERGLRVDDDRVRAIRDRMRIAKTRIDTAMRYVMFPEVRDELRGVQSDLTLALAYIGR